MAENIYRLQSYFFVDRNIHEVTTCLMHFYLIFDMRGDEKSFVYSCSIMLSESWWLDFRTYLTPLFSCFLFAKIKIERYTHTN